MSDLERAAREFAKQPPAQLRRLLRSRGWEEADNDHPAFYVFHTVVRGEQFVTGVPREELADYPTRVRDVLLALCQVHGSAPQEILRQVRHPGSDIITFRLTGPAAADGTISVDDSLRMRAARRQLLLAAAHSVTEPLEFFPRLGRQPATDFMRSCREAPPRAGSYVSDVLVPVAPQLVADDVEAPFSRRTTLMVANALESVATSVGDGDDGALLGGARKGLSANFLEALADLQPEGDAARIEISFSWSTHRPPPPKTTSKHVFSQEAFAPVREAGRVLRETAPRRDFLLRGFVGRVEADQPDQPGEWQTVIVGQVDDRQRRVQVRLEEQEDISIALEAMEKVAEVSIRGTLVRHGRSYQLIHNGALRLMTEPDDIWTAEDDSDF
ncbi:MAG: hypothetical protein VYE22_01080 [Myxococcota bacterium]|nr:hypothetical protein [Myxococcota bacterium]